MHIVDQMIDHSPRPQTTYPGFAESPRRRNPPAILKKMSKSVKSLHESVKEDARTPGTLKNNPVLTHRDP